MKRSNQGGENIIVVLASDEQEEDLTILSAPIVPSVDRIKFKKLTPLIEDLCLKSWRTRLSTSKLNKAGIKQSAAARMAENTHTTESFLMFKNMYDFFWYKLLKTFYAGARACDLSIW